LDSCQIEFQPMGRRGSCKSDQSVLSCAQQLGVEILGVCGGRGQCGCCKVHLLEGRASEVNSQEKEKLSSAELAGGYRLACQMRATEDLKITVPAESLGAQQRAQVEAHEVFCRPDPPVRLFPVKCELPSLADPRADDVRLLDELERQHELLCHGTDVELLRTASSMLRAFDWQVSVGVRGREVVSLIAPHAQPLGLAIDLGTTGIASYLVDLLDGHILARKGAINPQIAFGEDVITRLSRARASARDAVRLSESISEALNQLCEDLCAELGTDPQRILEAVIVGNTAMHHLFLRLPVDGLILAPYVPAVKNSLDLKARELGIRIAPGAYVHMLPNIAGFVGADHVATLLSTSEWRTDGSVLVLDMGTNTEICLICDGQMTAVSCPSGPAFEGSHIKHGMRAGTGAIERLRIEGERVEYVTIGGTKPVGLCGSGILDALAQLKLAGIVDASGRMGDHPRVHEHDGQKEFILVDEEDSGGLQAITITQKDIRELQLAKGSIAAGIRVLLKTQGCSEKEISKVVIGGAFGSYIDIASAVTIGLLPELESDRFIQVGNSAGMGAKLALISMAKREEAGKIASQVAYIELATFPGFNQIFAESTVLGYHPIWSGDKNGN